MDRVIHDERQLEEIESSHDKIAHGKLNSRRILMVIVLILISFFLFVLFFEFASIIFQDIPPHFFDSPQKSWSVIFIALIAIVLLVSVMIILSYKEYWEYFAYRHQVNRGYHTLTIDELFENENRRSIIKSILEQPGIHNNELLRQCNLQKGQLQWHLQVLIQYKIIRKEKIGQYSAYFPSVNNEVQGNNRELLLSKSKTKFEILNLIEDNPGINPSKIASLLNLNKSSVKYHVDKFIEEKMILNEQDGRKIRLYVKQEKTFY